MNTRRELLSGPASICVCLPRGVSFNIRSSKFRIDGAAEGRSIGGGLASFMREGNAGGWGQASLLSNQNITPSDCDLVHTTRGGRALILCKSTTTFGRSRYG